MSSSHYYSNIILKICLIILILIQNKAESMNPLLYINKINIPQSRLNRYLCGGSIKKYRTDDQWRKNLYYHRNDINTHQYYDEEFNGKVSPMSSILPTEILLQNSKRVAIYTLTIGIISTLLSISLFFNSTLMRIGNTLLLFSLPLHFGPTRVISYLLKSNKIGATLCLGVGFLIILAGWPMLGFIMEVFGTLNLLGNLFPLFWNIIKGIFFGGGDFASSFTRKSRNMTCRRNYSDYDNGNDINNSSYYNNKLRRYH